MEAPSGAWTAAEQRRRNFDARVSARGRRLAQRSFLSLPSRSCPVVGVTVSQSDDHPVVVGVVVRVLQAVVPSGSPSLQPPAPVL